MHRSVLVLAVALAVTVCHAVPAEDNLQADNKLLSDNIISIQLSKPNIGLAELVNEVIEKYGGHEKFFDKIFGLFDGPVALFRKAEIQNDPSAQAVLGSRYTIGDGVKMDPEAAIYWFTRSAKQGHLIGKSLLAGTFLVGFQNPPNRVRGYAMLCLAYMDTDEGSQAQKEIAGLIALFRDSLSAEDHERVRCDLLLESN